jgi:hypothetical protein
VDEARSTAAHRRANKHELTRERPLADGTRLLLLVYAGLGLAAGMLAFLGSDKTERYFSWTVKPGLTAAFLGANYLATFVFYLLCSRERTWARARLTLPAGFVFTSFMLLATLLHLDRFHLGAGGAVARFVAWAWLIVYIAVPPLTLGFLVYQMRQPGTEAARDAPLPPPLRLALAAQSLMTIGLGLALVIAPTTTAVAWSWPLTPLTARASGAWLLGIGTAAAYTAWENDVSRVRWAFVSFASLGVLQAVALARYPHTPDWNSAAAWIYAAFLFSLLAVGVSGLALTRILPQRFDTYGAR